jgi:serine/threonine protein kinase/formylglycine-generating enzyme required for sulfatase activity
MNSQVKRDPYKLVGTTLERYEIQELIGIGGMGVVYRAQHEITKARVAIKILRPDLTISNEEGVGFFFEEATKTVALRHPMIIKVISADYTPDGSAYMVMEWLDGRTLAEEMKANGAPSLQRVIEMLDQIADAVAYAHRKGIIHRDLKPGNIMLVREESGEESIRVLDFGIAKVLSTTIGTNTRVAGTSYYISPEQTIAHSPIDQGADIYSLGIILYQLLTGQVPFEGDSEGQVMDMHRSILPRPLRDIRPDISQAIEDVVLKAIAKRPLDRYPTAIDFARAFRQASNIAMSEIMLQCVDANSGLAVPQAEIYLNGKHEGRTGEDGWWSKKNMTPRQYLIEVESPRYVSLNRSVELQPNEELTVVAKLERKQIGELLISCNVPNANVEISGKSYGNTDQNGRLYLDSIAVGSYDIKITHPKYLSTESPVKVEVWKQAYAQMQLDIRPQHDLLKPVKRIIGELATQLATRWRAIEIKQTCSNCGGRVSLLLKFCTTCGTQVPNQSRWLIYAAVAAVAVLIVAIFIWLGNKADQILETKTGQPSAGTTAASSTGPDALTGTPAPTAPTQADQAGAEPVPPEGMIYISGGTFKMGFGSSASDNQSGPSHDMTVKPFFIDKYEVTVGAFRNDQNSDRSRLPATNVTWVKADSYCRSLGKRLPTEEEWEFAARGTTGRLYPWGDAFETGRANIANTSGGFSPVGSFPSGDSPFGVSDMSGNAMEWTASDFKSYPGSSYRTEPGKCGEPCKVIRGGAYFDQPRDASAVFRREYQPSALSQVRNAYAVLGFRCAKEITPR